MKIYTLSIAFFLLAVLQTPNLYAQIDLEKGLVAYYPFNEDAKDASGNENNGTVYGAKLEPDVRCGSPAYYFNGDENYIDFGNDESLNENFEGLTISAWVRPMSINRSDFGFVMGKWAFDEEEDHFAIFFTTKNTLDFTIGDGYDFGYGTYANHAWADHVWYHVMLVWDVTGGIQMYVNGKFDGKGKQHGHGINSESDVSLKMGREVVGEDRPFNGYIDEVRIYNRTLSHDELGALWHLEDEFCHKIIFQGATLNKNTDEPVQADIFIDDFDKKAPYKKLRSDSTYAEFSTSLPMRERYIVYPKAEGYLSETEKISTYDYVNGDVLYQNLYLIPIEVGTSVTLNNIFFDFDKAILRDESFAELNRLLDLFQQNPSMVVEIGGHTDDKGSDEYNEALSDRRANAVRTYLLAQEISENSVIAKGYGESEPRDSNDTEEGMQNNRRVEFKILEI